MSASIGPTWINYSNYILPTPRWENMDKEKTTSLVVTTIHLYFEQNI